MANGEISKLLREIKRKIGKSSNIKKIKVTSAKEIDSETKKKIIEQFVNQGEVEFSIDTNIIGGIKIKVGNKVYDGSLQSQLHELDDSIHDKLSEIIQK